MSAPYWDVEVLAMHSAALSKVKFVTQKRKCIKPKVDQGFHSPDVRISPMALSVHEVLSPTGCTLKIKH